MHVFGMHLAGLLDKGPWPHLDAITDQSEGVNAFIPTPYPQKRWEPGRWRMRCCSRWCGPWLTGLVQSDWGETCFCALSRLCTQVSLPAIVPEAFDPSCRVRFLLADYSMIKCWSVPNEIIFGLPIFLWFHSLLTGSVVDWVTRFAVYGDSDVKLKDCQNIWIVKDKSSARYDIRRTLDL